MINYNMAKKLKEELTAYYTTQDRDLDYGVFAVPVIDGEHKCVTLSKAIEACLEHLNKYIEYCDKDQSNDDIFAEFYCAFKIYLEISYSLY